MQRRTVMMAGLFNLWGAAACQAVGRKPGFGVVIRSELAPAAKPKLGVSGVADSGQNLFGFYLLDAKQASTSSYAGAGLPAWIQVTWREGDIVQDFATAGWKGGKIVGDYRVEVASRIPLDVQSYAAAGRDRAVRLIFRIKDDGVAMAWDVQDISANRQGWVYSMHGGDFKPAVFFNGKLVEQGWVILPDGRKVETDR